MPAHARRAILNLPRGAEAVVSRSKLVDYLLNRLHPLGRGKAEFFSKFGFRREEPEALRTILIEMAANTDMTEIAYRYGRKYVGVGESKAPNGEQIRLRTVWRFPEEGAVPVLVTAYPA